MNKLYILTFASSLVIACSQNNQIGNSAGNQEPTGFRQFKIDENKSALKISLFGVFMGTPDYESVWSVIEESQNNGLIDQIVQLGNPIEGGVSHCLVVANNTNRQQIINELKQAPTSLKESYYTVESISNCNQ